MRLRQAWVVWGLVIACAGSIVQARAARLNDGTAIHVRLTADLLSSQAAVGLAARHAAWSGGDSRWDDGLGWSPGSEEGQGPAL